jgi:hypothetical protein
VFHWLRLYRTFPLDRMRIFSCEAQEELNDQLGRENRGLGSGSVTAAQFLQEGSIGSQEAVWKALVMVGSGAGFLEKRRVELECGAGGDHDLPYQFSLPTSMPQALAWVKLLGRAQRGDVQP